MGDSKFIELEFTGDLGITLDRDPEAEKKLFASVSHPGSLLKNVTGASVTIHSEHEDLRIRSFPKAGLHPVLLENLELLGFEEPTPVQAYCIPKVIETDVLAISEAGSGKTAAYAIPTVNQFMGRMDLISIGKRTHQDERVQAKPLIMVIVPTRELALQIYGVYCRLAYRSRLRPCTAYGGSPRVVNIQELSQGCDVLIGTPGRLGDLIVNRPDVVSLERLKYTVLDEADEILQPDWEEQLGPLLAAGANDKEHRYLLYSATFPDDLRQLTSTYLARGHFSFSVGIGSIHKNVTQVIIEAPRHNKEQALSEILKAAPFRTIIFVNHNDAVNYLVDLLASQNYAVVGLCSTYSQQEREGSRRLFADNQVQILVCSSLGARGLDFPEVNHVINFDLPFRHGGIVDYKHRIGRTARIGNAGQATSLFDPGNDAHIAPELIQAMIDGDNEIPDFLEMYKDNFPTQPDNGADGGDGWGVGGGDGGWGATATEEPAAAGAGWGTDETVKPTETPRPDDWGASPAVSTSTAPTDDWSFEQPTKPEEPAKPAAVSEFGTEWQARPEAIADWGKSSKPGLVSKWGGESAPPLSERAANTSGWGEDYQNTTTDSW